MVYKSVIGVIIYKDNYITNFDITTNRSIT